MVNTFTVLELQGGLSFRGQTAMVFMVEE